MKTEIVIDDNISFSKEFFSFFGNIKILPGREICRHHLRNAEMLLVRSATVVDKTLLEDTPVKFVASATVGVDHIDLSYLRENNIGFARAPGSNTDSVAEYIITAVIMMAEKKEYKLSKLKLGLIGIGHIGEKVLDYARALGIRTFLYDPPRENLNLHEDKIYSSLDEVLGESDIVSLHVPLINDGENRTMRMVDDSFLSKMKTGAVLINTSRSKIIDNKALVSGFDRLGGLVLDVWDDDPVMNNIILRIADIGTPHIAGLSFDGKVRGTQAIYHAACAFFLKEPSHTLPEDIFYSPVLPIDTVDRINPVLSAVRQAYPLDRYDGEFRKILKTKEAEYFHTFDEIRRFCSGRLEFSHCCVNVDSLSPDVMEQLKTLGFNIVLSGTDKKDYLCLR